MSKKNIKLGTESVDYRGFGKVEFKDRYDLDCSIQCSSAIDFNTKDGLYRPGTSFLWLGVDDAKPQILASDARKLGILTTQSTGWIPYPVPEQVLMHTRMHLDRKQVRGLIKRLNEWLKNGNFEGDDVDEN